MQFLVCTFFLSLTTANSSTTTTTATTPSSSDTLGYSFGNLVESTSATAASSAISVNTAASSTSYAQTNSIKTTATSGSKSTTEILLLNELANQAATKEQMVVKKPIGAERSTHKLNADNAVLSNTPAPSPSLLLAQQHQQQQNYFDAEHKIPTPPINFALNNNNSATSSNGMGSVSVPIRPSSTSCIPTLNQPIQQQKSIQQTVNLNAALMNANTSSNSKRFGSGLITQVNEQLASRSTPSPHHQLTQQQQQQQQLQQQLNNGTISSYLFYKKKGLVFKLKEISRHHMYFFQWFLNFRFFVRILKLILC